LYATILYGSKEKTRSKWTGNLRAQSEELIVPGQNMAFSSKRSLKQMSIIEK